jgi:hypothetical protein
MEMPSVPNIIAWGVPFITAALAFCAYRYKNRIGYEVTTISGMPDETRDEITVKPFTGTLFAERLELTVFGYRALEDVELHYRIGSNPSMVKVKSTKTLSADAIELKWENDILKIKIPHLPSGEVIEIDSFRAGHSQFSVDAVKGTGGKYIVSHTANLRQNRLIIWTMIFVSAFLFLLLKAVGAAILGHIG